MSSLSPTRAARLLDALARSMGQLAVSPDTVYFFEGASENLTPTGLDLLEHLLENSSFHGIDCLALAGWLDTQPSGHRSAALTLASGWDRDATSLVSAVSEQCGTAHPTCVQSEPAWA